MKKMIHINVYAMLTIVAISCNVSSKDSVPGIYIKRNQINTIDTIYIYKDKYIQRIYTNEGKLIVDNEGSYEMLESGMVVFNHFYFNYDRDFIEFPEISTTSFGELAVFIRKGWGGVKFCSGHFEGENCYYRIP